MSPTPSTWNPPPVVLILVYRDRLLDDPRGEPPLLMAQAALLLATEPLDRVTGRVTYSQQILREFGWIEHGRGRGVDSRGSGYSEI